MSYQLPEISVPDASSRFNSPAGNGFVTWFAALRSSLRVMFVEVLNRATADAATYTQLQVRDVKVHADTQVAGAKAYTDARVESAKDYADDVVDAAINVSGIAIDTDGTPYFEPSSMNPRVFADTDGNPYFREL